MKHNINLLFITCILLFANNLMNAQECGIELLPEQIQYMIDTRDDRLDTDISLFSNNDEKVHLQIAAHIIRDSNSEKGLSIEDLKTSIADLNQTFESANFKFHICSVDYIDNDAYADGTISQGFNENTVEYEMALPYLVADAIDVFFVPVLYKEGINGWASFPSYVRDYGKDWIVLTNTAANNGSTLAHELGHYFSLYHTHQGSHDVVGWGDELVDASNCGYGVGDEICDTPADPTGLVYDEENEAKYHVGFCTDYSTCTFREDYAQLPCTFKDDNGDTYMPDIKNVMSYNYPHCRINFSPQQIIRMQTSYEFDRSYLSNYCAISCNNMLIKYEWLQAAACANVSNSVAEITIYKYNEVFNYLEVQNGDESNLYLSNGRLECSGAAVKDCIEELGLTEIIAECSITCPETCLDETACNYGEAGTCTFDCCAPIKLEYPWLEDIINNCQSIKVYDSASGWKFIEIQNNDGSRLLYLSNGTLFCSSEYQNVDQCKIDYGLIEVVEECNCGVQPDVIEGCTNPAACNYDVAATEDDGSCIVPGDACNDEDPSTINDQYKEDCICAGEQAPTVNTCEAIFNQYPWAEDEAFCQGERIATYEYDGWEFVQIDKLLYLSDGQNRYLEICDQNYPLGEAVQDCVCTSTTSEEPNCERHTGTVFYADCGGNTFRFIQTDDGQIFDPYFDLVDLQVYDGQRIQFDFIDNTEQITPCDMAEKAITITCLEEIDMVIGTCDDVFSMSEIASTIVDKENCNGESIIIYTYSEIFQYIYIFTDGAGQVYYDGALWASDDGDYRIAQTYGFKPKATWTCGCESTNSSAKTNGLFENTKTTELNNAESFKLFPNPANGLVQIELSYETKSESEVIIFDTSGKIVQQQQFTGNQITLKVAGLAKGMYIIEIRNEQTQIGIQKLFIE